jgi:hypothetical protein
MEALFLFYFGFLYLLEVVAERPISDLLIALMTGTSLIRKIGFFV